MAEENKIIDLLSAIDNITTAKLSKLKIDKTEICTIKVVKENGSYQVDNGNIKYYATALNNETYKENEQVCVTVIDGDYSKEKIIVGKYNSKNSELVSKLKAHINPHEKFLKYLSIPSENFSITTTIKNSDDTKWKDMSWSYELDQQKNTLISSGFGEPTLAELSIKFNSAIKFNENINKKYCNIALILYDTTGIVVKENIGFGDFIGNIFTMSSDYEQNFVFELPKDFKLNTLDKIQINIQVHLENTDKKLEDNEELYYDFFEINDLNFHFGYKKQDEKETEEASLETSPITSTGSVGIATDVGYNYYNLKEGKTESIVYNYEHYKNNIPYSPDGECSSSSGIIPGTNGTGKINDNENSVVGKNGTKESNNNSSWSFYNFNNASNANPPLWKNNWQTIQIIEEQDDWQHLSDIDETAIDNCTVYNVGLNSNVPVIRFHANSTFIASKILESAQTEQYILSFEFFVEGHSWFRESSYVNRVGIYEVNKNGNQYFNNEQLVSDTNQCTLSQPIGQWNTVKYQFTTNADKEYYFGFAPAFGDSNAVHNNCVRPNFYIRNIRLYRKTKEEPKKISASYTKNNVIYNANNQNSDLVLQWYKYEAGAADEGAGPWWKKIAGATSWEYELNESILKINESSAKFKIKIIDEDNDYVSPEIKIINENIETKITIDENNTESQIIIDDTDGIFVYDYLGIPVNGKSTYNLSVQAQDNSILNNEKNLIAWLFPKENTMINPPQVKTKYSENDEVDYYYWDYDPTLKSSQKPSLEDFNNFVKNSNRYTQEELNKYYIIERKCVDGLEQIITLQGRYQPNRTNNKIFCYLFDESSIEKISRELTCISTRNQGTEGYLGITPFENGNNYFNENNKIVKLIGQVFDNKGNEQFNSENKISYDMFQGALEFWLGNWNANNAFKSYQNKKIILSSPKNNSEFNHYLYQIVFQTNGLSNYYEDKKMYEDKKLGVFEVEKDTYYEVDIGKEDTKNSAIAVVVQGARRITDNSTYKNTVLISMGIPLNNQVYTNPPPIFYTERNDLKVKFLYMANEYQEDDTDTANSRNKLKDLVYVMRDGRLESIVDDCISGTNTVNGNTVYKINEDVDTVIVKIKKGRTNQQNYSGARPWINFFTYPQEEPQDQTFTFGYVLSNDSQNQVVVKNQWNEPVLLKAKYNWVTANGKTIALASYYGIPYFSGNNICYLDGPTQVPFTNLGSPSVYSLDYRFFMNNEEKPNFTLNFVEEEANTLFKINNENHSIKPPSLAPAEEKHYTLNVLIGEEIVAQYPFIIFRDTFAIKEVNDWNGETTVDKNYILSSMVGAGTKNSSNEFTGVIMGDVSGYNQTGLYGLKNGITTFGFKEDGSCFLGANEETGRIEFETGNNSNLKIISKNFDLQTGITVGTTVAGTGIRLCNDGFYSYNNGEKTFHINSDTGGFIFGRKGTNVETNSGYIEFDGTNKLYINTNEIDIISGNLNDGVLLIHANGSAYIKISKYLITDSGGKGSIDIFEVDSNKGNLITRNYIKRTITETGKPNIITRALATCTFGLQNSLSGVASSWSNQNGIGINLSKSDNGYIRQLWMGWIDETVGKKNDNKYPFTNYLVSIDRTPGNSTYGANELIIGAFSKPANENSTTLSSCSKVTITAKGHSGTDNEMNQPYISLSAERVSMQNENTGKRQWVYDNRITIASNYNGTTISTGMIFNPDGLTPNKEASVVCYGIWDFSRATVILPPND